MRKFALVVFVALLTGCANPYAQFYQGEADARKLPSYQSSTEEFRIYSASDWERDLTALERRGFVMIGSSSFSAGTNVVHEYQLREQATKVGAQLVLVSSKYSHTIQGAMPLTLPQTTTSYTNGNATAYGPGGTTSITGNATTTTYGSQTVMMPYAVDWANFLAVYMVRTKSRLGLFVKDLDDQTRQRLQSNKGLIVRNVVEGSPAFDADIIPGDVLLMIGNVRPASGEQYGAALDKYQGQSVKIKLDRNGVLLDKELRIRTFDQ